MRIISFPHAPMQAFWSAPVQALAPWINRIRHTFGNSAAASIVQHLPQATCTSFVPCAVTASNDEIFEVSTQRPNLSSSMTHQGAARSTSTLRVVREADAAIKPDCAGRMVISGRMADVCAELDRMAQQAAANTADA